MKLLILTEEQYPFTLGGGTSYLKEFEKGLNYHNIDYEILAPKFVKGSINKSRKIVNLGINLSQSNSLLLRSLFKLIYYPVWSANVLRYLIEDKKYKQFDVIHTHEIFFSGTLSLILAKLFNKKVVLTAHGKFVEGLKDRMYIPKVISFILGAYEKLIASKMDKIFCINREIREYYKRYNKNSTFIPNFIDNSKFKFKIRKEPKTIAYIGRLSKEKNVDLIIAAAPFLPHKKFLIIGDGPERESLENQAKKINAKNVHFLGRREDIVKLHQQIDIVVYLWENEPFGLAALEAMASGIPVIAADTNEMHYFVGSTNSGIVIPKNKIASEQLVKAIEKLEDKKYYSSCAKNAFKTSKDYDYRKLVGQYLKEIRELL